MKITVSHFCVGCLCLLLILGGGNVVKGGGGSTGLATYDFTGDCLDCPPPGEKGILGMPPPFVPVSAVLVLQNYQSGNPIYVANLVSFTYNGSNNFVHTPSTLPRQVYP